MNSTILPSKEFLSTKQLFAEILCDLTFLFVKKQATLNKFSLCLFQLYPLSDPSSLHHSLNAISPLLAMFIFFSIEFSSKCRVSYEVIFLIFLQRPRPQPSSFFFYFFFPSPSPSCAAYCLDNTGLYSALIQLFFRFYAGVKFEPA